MCGIYTKRRSRKRRDQDLWFLLYCSHAGALIEATVKCVHCALCPVTRCRRGWITGLRHSLQLWERDGINRPKEECKRGKWGEKDRKQENSTEYYTRKCACMWRICHNGSETFDTADVHQPSLDNWEGLAAAYLRTRPGYISRVWVVTTRRVLRKARVSSRSGEGDH